MDVTTDRDLFDFIEGRDVKEKDTSPATKVCDKEEKEEDVWQDIASALEEWTQRILDSESRHRTTLGNFRETIEESLRREQLDGFLTAHNLTELRYIATSCYTVSCIFIKRDIITYLLELYSLRQITSSLFIETCLKL